MIWIASAFGDNGKMTHCAMHKIRAWDDLVVVHGKLLQQQDNKAASHHAPVQSRGRHQ